MTALDCFATMEAVAIGGGADLADTLITLLDETRFAVTQTDADTVEVRTKVGAADPLGAILQLLDAYGWLHEPGIEARCRSLRAP